MGARRQPSPAPAVAAKPAPPAKKAVRARTYGAVYSAAHVLFDPATHTSRLPDGRSVPHVTAILGAAGVGTDFEGLSERSPRLATDLEAARNRGRVVHADCHAYDDDDLDLADVHPAVRPHVEAWAVVRETKRLTPLANGRERLLFHPEHCYCGITDGVFRCDDGRLILADTKTGDPEDAAAQFQTAAYEAAWNRMHPHLRISERWAIWLRPGRRVPYVIVNYTAQPEAAGDWPTFLACLTVYHAQPGRRRRRC